MMNIIGWVALIYIFIGCFVVISFYAILSYQDRFEWFVEETVRLARKYKALSNDGTIMSFITIVYIFTWVFLVIFGIYEGLLAIKKDRA